MPRFTGIPDLPQSGIEEWQYRVLDAMKQNIELLTDQRSEPDSASVAILRSNITVSSLPDANFRGITARGAGVLISNTQLPTYQDYTALITDVALLSKDVQALRTYVATLINQLRNK
jgi:hypothetical protein